jgi:pimeloyl-ACP methyl ester carboxylesterase
MSEATSGKTVAAERLPRISLRSSGLRPLAGIRKAMRLHFVLVAGPLVRASSWEPTAECLRAAGCHVQVPDVLAHHPSPPSWSAWTSRLIEQMNHDHEPIVVGHSSASALVAELATRLPTRGIIIVDGDVPPLRGAAQPVRPALHEFIKGLAEPDGMLPIWLKWFADDKQRASLVGIDVLARDAAAFARFEDGLPRMHIGWFDEVVNLADWSHIPAGFIQASAIYDHATAEAQRRGWPAANLHGTHLHPTLQPEETASAILAMSRQLTSGVKPVV